MNPIDGKALSDHQIDRIWLCGAVQQFYTTCDICEEEFIHIDAVQLLAAKNKCCLRDERRN